LNYLEFELKARSQVTKEIKQVGLPVNDDYRAIPYSAAKAS
jgi:hypothetical protein